MSIRISKNVGETKNIAKKLAEQIFPLKKSATVLGLSGELGSGKTTFLQGFAKGLKIKEKILSPTFILMKRFKLNGGSFDNFYHFDCYRLDDPKEILDLGFEKIISNPKNIVAIEWPEKISGILPESIISIQFVHNSENQRTLIFRDIVGGK